MHALFSHTNFPGQFGAFGAWLARQGWSVTFATARSDARPPPGCRMLRFDAVDDADPGAHRFASGLDRAMRTAEGFARSAKAARARGIMPDIVVAHSGWGAGSLAKAVWPEAAFVPYCEWWYRHPAVDRHPGARAPADEVAARAAAAARNAPMLVDLAQADVALCPSRFQAEQFPAVFRSRLEVLPDGVDCAYFAPDPGARAKLARYGVPDDAEVVSYATRGMEPYRGFPEFMRALAILQAERPRLHAVIGGRETVSYGTRLPEGDSWKKRMLNELDLDLDRLHFVGLLPYDSYRTVLQATDVHVYLTLPFVLSWSFVEALSVGAPIVASRSAPVREVVPDGMGPRCVDHLDVAALAAAIASLLDDREEASRRGDEARAIARERFDRAWVYPARRALLRRVVGGWSDSGAAV